MPGSKFGGDKKVGRSILTRPENAFKRWAVPRIPPQIETYHLTMLTLLWSAVNVAVAIVGDQDHLYLLWVVSAMVALQYLTDLLDGELGRQRNTGLIKWGFYMDHFLDYVFLCSLVFVAYELAPPERQLWYFVLVVVLGGFMVNSFLSFGATNEFEIYHFGVGPTETRLAIILLNSYLAIFGTNGLTVALPMLVGICSVALVFNTWKIQRRLWQIDMAAKRAAEEPSGVDADSTTS